MKLIQKHRQVGPETIPIWIVEWCLWFFVGLEIVVGVMTFKHQRAFFVPMHFQWQRLEAFVKNAITDWRQTVRHQCPERKASESPFENAECGCIGEVLIHVFFCPIQLAAVV